MWWGWSDMKCPVRACFLNTSCVKKSKFAQHAYEDHRVCLKEVKVLHIEQTPPTGNKESAHMYLVAHLMRNLAWISLPSGLYSLRRKLENYNSTQLSYVEMCHVMLILYMSLIYFTLIRIGLFDATSSLLYRKFYLLEF
jgi:hypothetical protein